MYCRQLVIAPLHHSVIHSLNSQNPSFADTVRLLERWVAGHYFSGHFEHESLELIVASVYLSTDKSATQPQSSTAGFLRCLSRYSSEHLLIIILNHIGVRNIEICGIKILSESLNLSGDHGL